MTAFNNFVTINFLSPLKFINLQCIIYVRKKEYDSILSAQVIL
jgi:hypothetical protein